MFFLLCFVYMVIIKTQEKPDNKVAILEQPASGARLLG